MSNPRQHLDKNTKRSHQTEQDEMKEQDETLTDASRHAHKKPKTIPQWPIKETRVTLPEIANTIATQEIDDTSQPMDGDTWLTMQFENQLATYTTHNKIKNQLIVDLSKNRQITEGMVSLLIDFITANKIIEINFVDSDFFTLANSAELVDTLNQHIHLQRCVVGENCVQLLAFPAHDMPIVLEFSKTRVQTDNIPAIAEFIRTHNVIAANFDKSNIFEHDDSGRLNVERLLQILAEKISLKSLSLAYTKMSYVNFEIIAAGFQRLAHLNLAGFCQTNFPTIKTCRSLDDGNQHTELLQPFVTPPRRTQSPHIAIYDFIKQTHLFIQLMAPLLRSNMSLISLNLSRNELDDADSAALIKSLRFNDLGIPLQQLNLSDNKMDLESEIQLDLWLATNPPLKQLNITTDTEVNRIIIYSLGYNNHLESLTLSCRSYHDGHYEATAFAIIKQLTDTRCTLRELNLSLLSVRNSTALRILETLAINTTLHTLRLTTSPCLSLADQKIALAALQQNFSLTTLELSSPTADLITPIKDIMQRNAKLAHDKETYWAFRACMTSLRRAYAKQKSEGAFVALSNFMTTVNLTSTAPTPDNLSKKIGIGPTILSYLFKKTAYIVDGENQDTSSGLTRTASFNRRLSFSSLP